MKKHKQTDSDSDFSSESEGKKGLFFKAKGGAERSEEIAIPGLRVKAKIKVEGEAEIVKPDKPCVVL